MSAAKRSVPNPYFSGSHPESDGNPRKIDVVVNLRESSIVSLAAHGVLDADQVTAGFRFRRRWEEISRIHHPAHLFERIDPGRAASMMLDREDEARRELTACRYLVGLHGFELLTKICGEGYHIRDLYPSRRERDTATDLLKIHLTAIAGLWR
jgi:hypothetical protein